MKQIGQHAIVIGASMGGLLAARALSDFYAIVTVLERDNFPHSDVPHSDVPRKGVPQGRHAHGLLARGRSVIENFFPGWTDEVVACGGAKGDIAGDVNWIGHGVTIKSAPSELVGLLASRPVLEGHVRRRLMALPNVRVIENCAVQQRGGHAGRSSCVERDEVRLNINREGGALPLPRLRGRVGVGALSASHHVERAPTRRASRVDLPRKRERCTESAAALSLAPIVAIRFRDDLPAVAEFHRHQIVGEIERRQLAAHLDEGCVVVRAVDGDDKILARLAFGFCRRPLAHPIQPGRYGEHLQLAFLDPAQIGAGVEDRAEFVGIAFIQAIKVIFDDGFDARSVFAHDNPPSI
jgi:hypothetical protein